MRIYFVIIMLIIAVFAFLYLFFNSAGILLAPSSENLQDRVCFGQDCFFVELAKTNAQREEGLMFRNKLAENTGMLFIFDREDIYPFWMRNTLIPLDIIWIGSNNKVLFINENTQPCLQPECPPINPKIKAKYVLEINAGVAEKTGIKAGDSAVLIIDN